MLATRQSLRSRAVTFQTKETELANTSQPTPFMITGKSGPRAECSEGRPTAERGYDHSMRLVLVLTEFPPSFGGMQTHAVEMAARLAAGGHGVRVLTYRGSEAERAEARRVDAGLPFPVQRCLSRLAYWANVERIAQAARDADLIYSSTVYFGQAGRLAGKPVLCRSAGNDVLRPWIAWPFRWGAECLDAAWFERYLYPRAKRWQWPERCAHWMRKSRQRVMRESAASMETVMANSDFTRLRLLEAGVPAERIEVAPGGVDTDWFRPMPRDEREGFVIMTAGRLVDKKGIEYLMEAASRLRPELPGLRMVIVGEGPHRAALEADAQRWGVTDLVRWEGRVEQRSLRDYYRAADVFALASRKGRGNDVETMGRVLCEAGACGVAVVASESGGIPSVVQDGMNGLLFREGDVADLCQALRRLYQQPKLRRKLAQGGRQRACAEFDWRVLERRQIEAMRRVIFKAGSIIMQDNHAGKRKSAQWQQSTN